VPSIALLLLGGVLLGNGGLQLVDVDSLGRGLETVISLAVCVILFEGGMTLDVQGYRRAPVVIRRLLSIGVLTTWLGVSVGVWCIFSLDMKLALVAGSLVIVTGPTVISPLLRRMVIRERLHHVLYWEGVLIDAIGVFIAVLCFEYLSASDDTEVLVPITRFLLRVVLGVTLGLVAGYSLTRLLRADLVPDHHVNIFVLAVATLLYGISNALLHESGLLTVVTAGLVIAVLRPQQLTLIKSFKLQLTELAIGLLFILLSAQLDVTRFIEYSGELTLLLLLVLFIIRPLVILLSTTGQGFDTKERLFLSWLAPRGIVAASMASLFSLRLTELGFANAHLLEIITYAIVGTTVIAQGLSAPWLAVRLGLERRERDVWLLAGQPPLVEPLEKALASAGVVAVSVDKQHLHLRKTGGADEDPDFSSDALDEGLTNPVFGDIDHVVCLWQDSGLNTREARYWANQTHTRSVFRWDAPNQLTHPVNAGLSVWGDLEPMERIIHHLEENTWAIETFDVDGLDDVGRYGPDFRPLFFVENERAEVVSEPSAIVRSRGQRTVVLKKRISGLHGLVQKTTILEGRTSWTDAVTAVSSLAFPSTLGSESTTLQRDLIERETNLPSLFGRGIAMPHSYVPGLTAPHCALAIVPAGVSLSTPDGQPVRLIAAVSSPQGHPELHLQTLSALAELLLDAAFVQLLVRQSDPERALRLITERT
jgi:NhaP-type Na+/H+ or K+/H+ antiporter/mannitol/fructose-specific phosphotransferase system IIA component (Ntr-type)